MIFGKSIRMTTSYVLRYPHVPFSLPLIAVTVAPPIIAAVPSIIVPPAIVGVMIGFVLVAQVAMGFSVLLP